MSLVSTLGKRFDSGSLPLAAEPHTDTAYRHSTSDQLGSSGVSALWFLPSTPRPTSCPLALHIHRHTAQRLPLWTRSLTGDHAQLTGSASIIRALIDRCLWAPLAEAIRRSLRDYRQHPGRSLVASHRPAWAVAAIPPRAHKTRRFNPCHAPSALNTAAALCPVLPRQCPVLSRPALPCPALPATATANHSEPQRTTASHSEPQRSPRASGRDSQGSDLPIVVCFFLSGLRVRTHCAAPRRAPAVEVQSSRPRSGIYGVSPWCAISPAIRTSSPARCRLGQGLLLGLTDLQTNITFRADCLPAPRYTPPTPPVPPTWPTPPILPPTSSHTSPANEPTATCL